MFCSFLLYDYIVTILSLVTEVDHMRIPFNEL